MEFKMKKLILKSALIVSASFLIANPAQASWVCHNDGGGCAEFVDGVCGHPSTSAWIAAHDMTCFGPVLNLSLIHI